jgi:predicted RNA-binding Zn-ribbon protein involved in translation (DUF1610 family)
MVGRLDAEITGTRLVLTGRIDETASGLTALAVQLPAGEVSIDTAGVTFVNSVGMREWMRLVRALRERGAVRFIGVADVLITQMNMVPEFKGSAIASFHAQYVCPSCGAEATPLIDVAIHGDALRQMTAPRLPCPECGAAMDLGDFPERYLSVFRA